MSSNGVSAPTSDDNLLAKESMVKANIKTIKEKKEKILAALQQLSKMEEPDKAMMKQLVDAFDSITAQENDYMGILTSIAEIQSKATEDVASDIKEFIEKKGKSSANGAEKEEETEESMDDINKESTLREIGEVQAAALAASMVNEQLVAKLNLSKSKHTAIKQARDDATAVQSETARVVMEEREKALREVANERKSMENKKKELDKLRKTVVKKECEGEEGGEGEIEVDESARIPPLKSKEEEEEEERKKKEAEEEREKTLEQKRAEIRARVDAERKRREGAAQTIREKLAAMEKRKERMGEIRRILSGISQSQEDAKKEEEKVPETPEQKEEREKNEVERTRMEIEMNLEEASMSLKHLTQLREKLEAMQASGQEPSEEDEEMLRRFDEAERVGDEFEHCCPACGRQFESPVVSRKRTLLRRPPLTSTSLPPSQLSLPPVPLSFPHPLSSMDTLSRDGGEGRDGQLTRIEEALAAQRNQLTILVRRGDREEEHTMSRQLHSLLLSSSPRVLSTLSSICSDLSRGKAVPSLERVLETLLDPHDLTVSSLSSVDDLVYENRTTQEASSSTDEVRNRREEEEKMQNGVREEKEVRETLTVERVVEAIQQQCIQVIEGEESIDERVKQRLLETTLSMLSSLPLSRSFLLQSSSLIDASITPFLSLPLPEYSIPLLEDIADTLTSHLELANVLTAIPPSP